MSLLSDVMDAVAEVQSDAELLELRFRHTLTWSDGTTCRVAVQDPNRTDQGVRLAQRLTGTPEVLDVRFLRVHPADEPPGTSATANWQGGLLQLVSWGDVSDFTDQAVGICRWSR